MENDIRRNGSGYVDPTAYKAIRNATKEERKREVDPEQRFNDFLTAIFAICDLSDFHIEERIVVKDKRTGKIWRRRDMIFVVKSGIKRDAYDTQKLRNKLYKELNEIGKNQVVMLPSDCKYDVINDYNSKDIKVIIKEIEKG